MKKLTNSNKYFENVKCKHSGIYIYHNDYTGSHNKIRITCKKHGDFYQKSYVHKQGSGCPDCSGNTFNSKIIISDFKKQGYIILNNITSKMGIIECKCSKGHTFTTSVNRFNEKKELCKECSYINRKNTKIERGIILPDSSKTDYEVYTRMVWKLTERTIKTNKIKNISKRSREYHLDHRYSIYEGFSNNIIPSIIAYKNNLEIIPQSKNIRKK